MAELTPMMRQYLEIKEQNPGCLLFFRLGDFYEMFAEDAKLVSRELDLTLTTRDRGKEKEEQTPMCGVPYHSSEAYIARLVAKGYKVAICEQMEDPAKAKGLVKRDVVRVVSPGSVTESSMLDESRNNYFGCVFGADGQFGLCFCDISTGLFSATLAEDTERMMDELGRFQPAELLLGGTAVELQPLKELLRHRLPCCVDVAAMEQFDEATCRQSVLHQFGMTAALPQIVEQAAGALLAALKRNQKSELSHIRELDYFVSGKFMDLDLTARRNLELTQTLRSCDKRGSLLWVLDKTKTALGSRMLRSWMERPLLNPQQISRRLDAVEELVGATVAREELLLLLRQVCDLERVMARIVTGTCNGRDMLQLAGGVACLPELKTALQSFDSDLLQELCRQLDDLSDIKAQIDCAISPDAPLTVREGGIIRTGYDPEIDRLQDILSGGKNFLPQMEAREKEKTGIKNLRVSYNRVFGYYIEVAKSQTALVPETYIRRQTTANAERYITEELKELENTILNAKDQVVQLEYEAFCRLRESLAAAAARVQQTAGAVAAVDTLACFASLAVQHNYCRPEVDLSGSLQIDGGRHPVVEQVLRGQMFVPNDTRLGMEGCQVAIITGPNMAGKSTYMRQVALIVLMAQMGCFVPAKAARIGVVDRLFTRIGASDDLASGQSTFMVEMQEVADILKYATSRSLLILDEIGRGTSTYDGMAIARAVLEYAADRRVLGAKTLFATHYHELTCLSQELDGVKNFNIAVKKRQDDMIFLRKIVPGAADRSYGVEVAKLAGLPDKVVSRARAILRELETQGLVAPAPIPQPDDQISLIDMGAAQIRQRLETVTVETLTPIEAMNMLYELKQLLGQ